jgi:hypothetical protein
MPTSGMSTSLCVLLLVLLELSLTSDSFRFTKASMPMHRSQSLAPAPADVQLKRPASASVSASALRLAADPSDDVQLTEVWLQEKLPQIEKRMNDLNRSMPPLDPPAPPDVQLKRPASASVSVSASASASPGSATAAAAAATATMGAVAEARAATAATAAPAEGGYKLPLPFMQTELGVRYVTCITIIDTLIHHMYTNDAYYSMTGGGALDRAVGQLHAAAYQRREACR